MNDLRIFFLELLAFSRKSSRTPESILSSISITAVVFSLTLLILLAIPVFMTKELALLFIYGLAIFEIILGLRVGLLRIGQNPHEQYLSTASRYWKRSFPYLFPALFIPIPIAIVITNFLATNPTNWWLILVSILTSYMMFFFLGVAWSMVIRVVAKRPWPRIVILILAITVLFSAVGSGDFIFRTILTSQSHGDFTQLLVIIAQLSATAFLVLITEIALRGIRLTTQSFGKFWPILLNGRSLGYGQGSSTFFATNKLFIRSTAFHRRIISLILSLLLFLLIIHSVLFVGGSAINQSIVLISILVFTAVSALLISRPSAQLANRSISLLRHLPVNNKKILAGAWLAGLAWQTVIAVLFYGVVGTWININPEIIILIIIGASTQHLLFFGWSKKLTMAVHHNLSLFAVFSLAVLVGILPVLLLPVAGIVQTILMQLIWLGFIGILLHTTTGERTVTYA